MRMRRSLCDVESRLKMTPPLSVARAALLVSRRRRSCCCADARSRCPCARGACARCGCARGRARIEYGVRFGPAFTTLTSVETFDVTVAAAAREPTMNFGGFISLNLFGPLALQPEVLFAAKGHRIHDKDAQPIVSGTGVTPPKADRVILLRYLEIPLLLRASKQTAADSSFYLIAGPALGDASRRRHQGGERTRASSRTSPTWSAATTCRWCSAQDFSTSAGSWMHG